MKNAWKALCKTIRPQGSSLSFALVSSYCLVFALCRRPTHRCIFFCVVWNVYASPLSQGVRERGGGRTICHRFLFSKKTQWRRTQITRSDGAQEPDGEHTGERHVRKSSRGAAPTQQNMVAAYAAQEACLSRKDITTLLPLLNTCALASSSLTLYGVHCAYLVI